MVRGAQEQVRRPRYAVRPPAAASHAAEVQGCRARREPVNKTKTVGAEPGIPGSVFLCAPARHNPDMEKKDLEEDAAEKALELTCRWLHAHKMALNEKITTDGLYTGVSLYSPEGKTVLEGNDFPEWDWAGEYFPKKDAVLAVVQWLFREDGGQMRLRSPSRRRGSFAQCFSREVQD